MDVPSVLEFFDKFNTTLPEEEREKSVGLLREAIFQGNLFPGWARIVILLIASVGLIGNSLVLWLLGFRTQRNPFSVYILNLAAADFLFLLSPFLCVIHRFTPLSLGANIVVFLVTAFLIAVSYSVGLSLLAAISTERCLSVLFPIWYRCHRPKHTSAVLCALLWALPLFFIVVFFSAFLGVGDDIFLRILNMIQGISFCSLIPLLCVSSLTLLLRVHCSSQRRQPPRLYGVILLSVLVFLLCGVPLGIKGITRRLGSNFMPLWISLLLTSVNSSANPFIYFFLGKLKHWKKKEPLREVLMRSMGNEAEIGGDGERKFPTPTP